MFFKKRRYFCIFNFLDVKNIMIISLNNQSRASIAKATGIAYDDLLSMDIDSIEAIIEKKIGKKLKYKSISDPLIGRGSVYLYLNRLFDIDTEKLDRYIDRIK